MYFSVVCTYRVVRLDLFEIELLPTHRSIPFCPQPQKSGGRRLPTVLFFECATLRCGSRSDLVRDPGRSQQQERPHERIHRHSTSVPYIISDAAALGARNIGSAATITHRLPASGLTGSSQPIHAEPGTCDLSTKAMAYGWPGGRRANTQRLALTTLRSRSSPIPLSNSPRLPSRVVARDPGRSGGFSTRVTTRHHQTHQTPQTPQTTVQ